MLIRVPQHTARDLEAWERATEQDEVHARSDRHRRAVERASNELAGFASSGPCYLGVSWGKDSVCLAHLAAANDVRVPVVYVAVHPLANPHNPLVRDAFLARHTIDYHEIAVDCASAGDALSIAGWRDGFAQAARLFGARHISGVRGDESKTRALRMRRFGMSTESTCAPLGWWSAADVFAYLHAHDLPVHPAYAMSMGGLLPRERLRVASIGGKRGQGMGRGEWEQRYYGWRLAEIRASLRQR